MERKYCRSSFPPPKCIAIHHLQLMNIVPIPLFPKPICGKDRREIPNIAATDASRRSDGLLKPRVKRNDGFNEVAGNTFQLVSWLTFQSDSPDIIHS